MFLFRPQEGAGCPAESCLALFLPPVRSFYSFPSALVWTVFTTLTLDGGAMAMLMPSVLATAISAMMNITIFLNRLPSRERRRALHAMGLEEWK